MKKDDQLKIRLSTELKNKIKQAAWAQRMTASEYIRDRLGPHVEADLTDFRKLLDDYEVEYSIAA